MGIDARFLERRPPADTKMLVDFRQGSSREEIYNANATTFRDTTPPSFILSDSSGGYFDLNGTTGSNRFCCLEYGIATFPWLNIAISQPVAVACWAKPEATTGFRSMITRLDSNNNTLLLALDQSARIIQARRIGSSGGCIYSTGSGVYSNSAWSHFAFTFNSGRSAGSRIKIYVNGAALATTTSADTVPTLQISSGPITIGASYLFIDGFYGEMTKVQVYFADLQDQDILDLYNGGR